MLVICYFINVNICYFEKTGNKKYNVRVALINIIIYFLKNSCTHMNIYKITKSY